MIKLVLDTDRISQTEIETEFVRVRSRDNKLDGIKYLMNKVGANINAVACIFYSLINFIWLTMTTIPKDKYNNVF